MSKHIRSIHKNQSGAAAAEMALIAPLLMILMFGSMELGHYFWTQHKVVKAMRDASRYAARQPFTSFTCTTIDPTVEANIANFARTSTISGQGTPKIWNWTSNNSIVVVPGCRPAFTQGIYNASVGGAPVVTVRLARTGDSGKTPLAYPSLFEAIGFDATDIKLQGSATAAVMGL
jgi:Flp pilus assembly protein TadG